MAAEVVLHDLGLRHLIREIAKVSQNELSHFEVETVVENATQHLLDLKTKHPFEKQYVLSQLKKISTYEQLVKFNNVFKRKAQQQVKPEKYSSGHTLRQINARLEILDLFGQKLSKQLIKNIRQFQQHMNMQFAENYCYEAKKYVQNLQRDFYLQTSKTVKSPQQIQQLCDILLNISDDVGLLRFFFEKFEQNISFYKQQNTNYNIYDKIHKQQLEDLKQKELQIGKAVSQTEWDQMKQQSVINYSFDDQYALNQIDRLVNNKIFLFSERKLAIEIILQLREISNFGKQQNCIRNYMRKHSQATYINYLLQIVLKKVLYINYFINYYQFLCDFDGAKTLKKYEKYDIVQNAINKQNAMVSNLEKSQRQRFFQYVDDINIGTYDEDSDIIKQPKPPDPDKGYENTKAHQEFTQNLAQMAKNIANQDWRVQLENKDQVTVNAYNAQTMRMSELALLQTKLTDKFNKEALSQYQSFIIGENQQMQQINNQFHHQQQGNNPLPNYLQNPNQIQLQPYQQFVPNHPFYSQTQIQPSLQSPQSQSVEQQMLVYGDSGMKYQQIMFKTPQPYSEIEKSQEQHLQQKNNLSKSSPRQSASLNDIIVASQSVVDTNDSHNQHIDPSKSAKSLHSDGSAIFVHQNQELDNILQPAVSFEQQNNIQLEGNEQNTSQSKQCDQNLSNSNPVIFDQISTSQLNEPNVQTITITAPVKYNKTIKKEKLQVEYEQAIAVREKLLEMRSILISRLDVANKQYQTLNDKYSQQLYHQQKEFNDIVNKLIDTRLQELNKIYKCFLIQQQQIQNIQERFQRREEKQQQLKLDLIKKRYKPLLAHAIDLQLIFERQDLSQFVQKHHYNLLKSKQRAFEIQKKMAKLNVLRFNRLIYGFMWQKKQNIKDLMEIKLNNVQIYVDNEYKLHNLRDHYDRLLIWFKEDELNKFHLQNTKIEKIQSVLRLHKKRKDLVEILVLKKKRLIQSIKVKGLLK